MVRVMRSSSVQPSWSAPRRITSREQPAANFLSLNFYFTLVRFRSFALFEGYISTTAPRSPVNSSTA